MSIVIGILIFLVVLCTSYYILCVWFYSNIFERKAYLTRRSLYKRMKKDISFLGEIHKIEDSYCWDFEEKHLSYFGDNTVALFENEFDCLLSDFNQGLFDSFYYYEIKKMLIKQIKTFEDREQKDVRV